MNITAQAVTELRAIMETSVGINSLNVTALDQYVLPLNAEFGISYRRVTPPELFPMAVEVYLINGKEDTLGAVRLIIPCKETVLVDALWSGTMQIVGGLYTNYLKDILGIRVKTGYATEDVKRLIAAKVFSEEEIVITDKGYDITLEQNGEVLFHDTMIRRSEFGYRHEDKDHSHTYTFDTNGISPVEGAFTRALQEAITVRLFTHPAMATVPFPIQ